MAKQRLKSPRARLFVALDLPAEVRDGLERWQKRALTDPALRPMRPESLHVTLCFLSYHPEKAIPRIAETVGSIPPRAVELRFEAEPTPLPKGRPGLYALGAESEAAVELQAEVSDALERKRFYEPEKRSFWPHVTVARVRSERRAPGRGERRGRARPRRVERAPGAIPKPLQKPFCAASVVLYRSLLHPQGAEYVRLAELNLLAADAEER